MATTVLLFYKYVDLSADGVVDEVIAWQRQVCEEAGVKQGRILVATEGINGTLAGTAQAIQTYCDKLAAGKYFREAHAAQPIDFKTSTTDEAVLFADLAVKRMGSICGGGEIAKTSLKNGGRHLSPADFHEALKASSEQDTVILDCRNDYEYAIGHFKNAIDPGTKHFHEFAKYVDENKNKWIQEGKKVLMYCTGGIRCEKASVRSRIF